MHFVKMASWGPLGRVPLAYFGFWGSLLGLRLSIGKLLGSLWGPGVLLNGPFCGFVWTLEGVPGLLVGSRVVPEEALRNLYVSLRPQPLQSE